MKKNIYLFGIMACLACVSCEKISYPELDFILKCTTLDATEVTETSAILSGTINMDFTEIEGTNTCGFFYNTYIDNVTYYSWLDDSNNIKTNISSGKEFSVQLCELTPGRTYYYRAYLCTNDELYRLGEVKSFTTK